MKAATFHRISRFQRGVGLIEVLVAVLVLAIGLLGIAALQASALRNSQNSFERTQAVTLTYSMLDVMRANRDSALIGAYNIPTTCNPPATGARINTELHNWISEMHDVLGENACGRIDCNGVSCTVEIEWMPTGGGSANPTETDKVRTVTRL